MIVTTYTCDRCNHSQEESEQMWDIAVIVTHKKPPVTYGASREVAKKALWCRSRITLFGLLPVSKEDKPTLKPPPTLEDIIREIVQDEIGEAISSP